MKLFYIALGCVFGAAIVAAGDEQSKENLIARGKYLVEEVAMCQECHTPRDDSGYSTVVNGSRGPSVLASCGGHS